jgi:hypothetical protein
MQSLMRVGKLISESKVEFQGEHIECLFLQFGFYKSNGLDSFPTVGDTVAFALVETNKAVVFGAVNHSCRSDSVILRHNSTVNLEARAEGVKVQQKSLELEIATNDGKLVLRSSRGEFFSHLGSWFKSLVQVQGAIVQTFLGPGSLNPGVVEKVTQAQNSLKLDAPS